MANSELVILKGGVSVLLPAVRLALRLEDEGFTLRAGDDGRLCVEPPNRLTRADCVEIRTYKHELLRIIAYEAPAIA